MTITWGNTIFYLAVDGARHPVLYKVAVNVGLQFTTKHYNDKNDTMILVVNCDVGWLC